MKNLLWFGCALWLRLRAFASAHAIPNLTSSDDKGAHTEERDQCAREKLPVKAYRAVTYLNIVMGRSPIGCDQGRNGTDPFNGPHFPSFHFAALSSASILAQFSTAAVYPKGAIA